jgi:hypothetical protein
MVKQELTVNVRIKVHLRENVEQNTRRLTLFHR